MTAAEAGLHLEDGAAGVLEISAGEQAETIHGQLVVPRDTCVLEASRERMPIPAHAHRANREDVVPELMADHVSELFRRKAFDHTGVDLDDRSSADA